MITKLAWRNIWFKPLNTILSIILLTSSVAIITILVLLEKQFEEKFSNNINGVDLVLGAKGSPLQLVLSAVYQIDAPTGNINYDSAKVWMQHRFVKKAIPMAFGDNYKGYKILGTTADYLHHFDVKLAAGKVFEKNFEVVLGGEIANKLNVQIGDTFFGSHGSAAEGEIHDHYPYKIVGITKPNGKVMDNVILCNIPSVWQMHGNHEDNADENTEHGVKNLNTDANGMDITAVLLQLRNPMAKLTWQRLIPQNTKMQAASPVLEINRLFSLFGIGFNALKYLAYGIMLISGISIFIALFNTLKERESEFALLRVNGAKRTQLLKLIMIESMLLCTIGFLFGTILGRVGLMLLSNASENDFKLSFNPYEFIWQKEGFLFFITLVVGFVAALIPAIKAYKLNISKTLAHA